MPEEEKVDNLIDVGEADQQPAEINLDDKGEPEKTEAPVNLKLPTTSKATVGETLTPRLPAFTYTLPDSTCKAEVTFSVPSPISPSESM